MKRNIQSPIGKSLVSLVKTILYEICRYETQIDRKERIETMQNLLDTEHKARLGWSVQ